MERKLTIQFGVVKRMKKEFDYYQTEVSEREKKRVYMINKKLNIEDDVDEHKYHIKKHNELLKETYDIFLISKNKYTVEVDTLENIYNEIKKCDLNIEGNLLVDVNTFIDEYYKFM
jgi:hypothetical protein